jgi:hypothetical protein
MKITPQRLIRAAGNRTEFAFRFMLCLFLHIDRWHQCPLAAKDYALDIIKYLNAQPKRRRRRVVEIGCGIGDILLNLDFEERHGLDSDRAVLKGAEFFRRSHFKGTANFTQAIFPECNLEGVYSAIIMVGWTHAIAPEILRGGIRNLVINNLDTGGILITDTVSGEGYPHRHSHITLFDDLHGRVENLGSYVNTRQVFSFTKSPAVDGDGRRR